MRVGLGQDAFDHPGFPTGVSSFLTLPVAHGFLHHKAWNTIFGAVPY